MLIITNLIALTILAIAIICLIYVSKKLNKTISFSKELAKQISITTQNIEHARQALNDDFEALCMQDRKLQTRLIETGRVKKEMKKLLFDMEQTHINLKISFDNINSFKNSFEQNDFAKKAQEMEPLVPQPQILHDQAIYEFDSLNFQSLRKNNNNQEYKGAKLLARTLINKQKSHQSSSYLNQQNSPSPSLQPFSKQANYQEQQKQFAPTNSASLLTIKNNVQKEMSKKATSQSLVEPNQLAVKIVDHSNNEYDSTINTAKQQDQPLLYYPKKPRKKDDFFEKRVPLFQLAVESGKILANQK